MDIEGYLIKQGTRFLNRIQQTSFTALHVDEIEQQIHLQSLLLIPGLDTMQRRHYLFLQCNDISASSL